MIKLKKVEVADPYAGGNGFGGHAADWVTAKNEGIAVRNIGTRWVAIQGGQWIAASDTKRGVIEQLHIARPELIEN